MISIQCHMLSSVMDWGQLQKACFPAATTNAKVISLSVYKGLMYLGKGVDKYSHAILQSLSPE